MKRNIEKSQLETNAKILQFNYLNLKSKKNLIIFFICGAWASTNFNEFCEEYLGQREMTNLSTRKVQTENV